MNRLQPEREEAKPNAQSRYSVGETLSLSLRMKAVLQREKNLAKEQKRIDVHALKRPLASGPRHTADGDR